MREPGAEGFDVLVRGAGPVGCTLALALLRSRLRVAVLRREAPAPAFRPIALSHASRLILERVGAWQGLPATPIRSIEVSQQEAFGRTRMEAADAGVPALGYVVDYAVLWGALRERLNAAGVEEVSEERPAGCTVHAEGMAPDADEKRYRQDAVVCLVTTAPPAGGTAFERFTAEGPLALLPFAGRYAVVWSATPERARSLADLPEASFLEALSAATGSRAGRPVALSSRAVYPLALRVRRTRTGPREVYIGNAAQTLHPVAGQGLNLGLRDAWELARVFRDAQDPGDPAALARYESRRKLDAFSTIRVTDLLAGGFTGSSRLARSARGLALALLDVAPGPRRFFARRMIYGPSALP